MADRINFEELECGDLVRILLSKSDLVVYVWGNFEKEFGLRGKIKGLEDTDIIFSTLNPLGTTIDKFVDNVQFFGVSHQRDYLKVSTRIGEPITYDQPTMLVYGYELIEKKPRIL